jgi:hypothetical protein
MINNASISPNFDSEEHLYIKPEKRIHDEASLKKFHNSTNAIDLAKFIVEA